RVVFEIRYYRLRSARVHSEPGGLRPDQKPQPLPARMTRLTASEINRRERLCPGAILLGIDVDVVVHTAADEESVARGRPGKSGEGVVNLNHLPLLGRLGERVEDEDVLIGFRGDVSPSVAVVSVVPGGQNQKRPAIRAHCGGHRLAGDE